LTTKTSESKSKTKENEKKMGNLFKSQLLSSKLLQNILTTIGVGKMKFEKNVFIILMAMCLFPFIGYAGEETIAEWKFTNTTAPTTGIGMYVNEEVGAKAKRFVDPTVSSPSGAGAYVVEILQKSKKGAGSDIQMDFNVNKLLTASTKYKITVTCKASSPVSVVYTAMYALRPWDFLSKESSRTCDVKTSWETFELIFIPEKDISAEARINTPRFYMGSLPDAAKFYISEVKFVKITD
jgi:hypothetical protein